MEEQKEKTMAERFPMNVPQETFDAWQLLRRVGDPELIARSIKASRPTVDKALKYGHVKKQWVATKITNYFKERRERELKQGTKLIESVTN